MIHTNLENFLLAEIKDRGTSLTDEVKEKMLRAEAELEKEIDKAADDMATRLRRKLRDIDDSYKLELGGDRVDDIVRNVLENIYKTYSY